MIRMSNRIVKLPSGWPRTSGDDPGPEGAPLIVKELAPHERG